MIYLNGRLVSGPEAAAIDPRDRGLLLGDGLFETLLCRGGRPLDFDAHIARLAAGARLLRIPFGQAAEEVAQGADALLQEADLAEGFAALRITLTRGPGPRGLLPPQNPNPTLLMSAQAMTPGELKPAKVILASTRRNEHSPLANLKTLGYLDNVLAKQEAAERGADEALMLNTAGRLCCGSASNVFLLFEQRLVTPPLSEGVLPGITRARILDLAQGLGLGVEEKPLWPHDLETAGGVFLTNSLMGVRAAASVEDKRYEDEGAIALIESLSTALRGDPA